jgi:MtN3 and saliva related transmembrane protein
MTETVLGIMAGSWAVLMAVSPILQIRQILRMRSSREVSIPYFVVLIVGFLLWIAYGVAIENPALIIPNSVATVVGVTTIVVARHFR